MTKILDGNKSPAVERRWWAGLSHLSVAICCSYVSVSLEVQSSGNGSCLFEVSCCELENWLKIGILYNLGNYIYICRFSRSPFPSLFPRRLSRHECQGRGLPSCPLCPNKRA